MGPYVCFPPTALGSPRVPGEKSTEVGAAANRASHGALGLSPQWSRALPGSAQAPQNLHPAGGRDRTLLPGHRGAGGGESLGGTWTAPILPGLGLVSQLGFAGWRPELGRGDTAPARVVTHSCCCGTSRLFQSPGHCSHRPRGDRSSRAMQGHTWGHCVQHHGHPCAPGCSHQLRGAWWGGYPSWDVVLCGQGYPCEGTFVCRDIRV